MANVRIQDLTAIIHGTSKYNGGKYDTVHVENIIQTDDAINPNSVWYVPSGSSINPVAAALFKATNTVMYPRTEEELLKGTDDTKEEALKGDQTGLIQDFSQLMMMSLIKKVTLSPIPDCTNLYSLSYDYKLYPKDETTKTFEFISELPFSGLMVAPNGGAVQMTVIMPINSQIDAKATKGTDTSGKEITELVTNIPQINRNVVTFKYQIDPLFNIVYHY